ncbi:MAG: dephospho-CoA kinase [Thermodesulfobacteriota bacterium]
MTIEGTSHRLFLGITGTIGSGKSSVSRCLAANFQLRLLDADAVCRSLTAPGAAGYRLLVEDLPACFFGADGSLDRSALRRAIFAEPRLRERINALLHPLARQCIREEIRREGGGRVAVEVALLFEAGWAADFDSVLLVYADQERIAARLAARDRLSPDEVRSALAAQWPMSRKIDLADHVVDNSGPWPDTCLQVLHLGDRLGLIRRG